MGSRKQALIRGCPNGATRMVEDHPPAQPERTPGTETSQYREEEKETIDTLSRGDRKGQSLNRCVQGHAGVVGAVKGSSQGTGSAWKRAA